jgi:hypothetical protein
MRRRTFIAGLCSASAWPVVVRAQQSKVPIIGFLHPGTPNSFPSDFAAGFAQGLKETGLVEGQTVPPNGFVVHVFAYNANLSAGYGYPGEYCFLNDNGPASLGGGFYILPDQVTAGTGTPTVSGTFASPHGYKPIGPVSIWCQNIGNALYVAARGW